MRVSSRILFCLLLLTVGVPRPVAAQTPVPASTPDLSGDPFCDESVDAIPWNATANAPANDTTSDALALAVFSRSKQASEATMHVTLISDADAYDVLLTHVRLGPDSNSPTVVVTLPKQTAIRYAYVDSYRTEGGADVTCPSDPRVVAPYGKVVRIDFPQPGSPRFAATFTQPLPPLPCGRVFTRARVTHAYRPRGFTVDKTRTVDVEVFVDSDGRLVKADVYRSSGVDYMDERAVAAAEHSWYAPATFLCVPVVGRLLYRVDFIP